MFRLPPVSDTNRLTGPYNPDSDKFSEVSKISRGFQPIHGLFVCFTETVYYFVSISAMVFSMPGVAFSKVQNMQSMLFYTRAFRRPGFCLSVVPTELLV